METVYVAYALDNNYAELTCVSMASMLFNTDRRIHFHVVESHLSEENKEKLHSLEGKFPHGRWSFHHIDGLDDGKFIAGGHLSVEVYYRLLLPDLLPDVDKIIYLDGDTVVDGDIRELWDVELNGAFLAAAPEKDQMAHRRKKDIFGIEKHDIYFNSGVLVLDLEKLRAFGLFEKSRDIVSRLYDRVKGANDYWHRDQDVLNYFFSARHAPLAPRFNYIDSNNVELDCHPALLKEWAVAFEKPVVIHYISSPKPNRLYRNIMSSRLWERYYAYKPMTPYGDAAADAVKVEKYRLLEKQLDDSLALPSIIPAYFRHRRHSLYMSLAASLPDRLYGKKVALWGVSRRIGHLLMALMHNGVQVDLIVDGLEIHQGTRIYDHCVVAPEELCGKSDDYFVILAMQNRDVAQAVGTQLGDYGFSENGWCHVYAPLWDRILSPI